MTDDALPQTKADLLVRIERSRVALQQAIDRLSEARLVAPGADGWSAKDHLAHLAAWEAGIAALLEKRPRYAAMQLDEETFVTAGEERINALIQERNKDRPLQDVLSAFGQGHRELLAALEPLSDADLFKTYSHYQPDEPGEDSGAPILGWVAGNSYEHYEEHQRWIEALVGERT